jgi:hypothetical protein
MERSLKREAGAVGQAPGDDPARQREKRGEELALGACAMERRLAQDALLVCSRKKHAVLDSEASRNTRGKLRRLHDPVTPRHDVMVNLPTFLAISCEVDHKASEDQRAAAAVFGSFLR